MRNKYQLTKTILSKTNEEKPIVFLYGYKIENISLDLHNSKIEGNIETEYEKKFSESGNKIYYLHAKKDV